MKTPAAWAAPEAPAEWEQADKPELVAQAVVPVVLLAPAGAPAPIREVLREVLRAAAPVALASGSAAPAARLAELELEPEPWAPAQALAQPVERESVRAQVPADWAPVEPASALELGLALAQPVELASAPGLARQVERESAEPPGQEPAALAREQSPIKPASARVLAAWALARIWGRESALAQAPEHFQPRPTGLVLASPRTASLVEPQTLLAVSI